MAHDIIGNLERLGWRCEHNGGGTHIMRKGRLVLSGYDGDLPDDHWFMVALYDNFDDGECEPLWSIADGTAEWADCGPAMELHNALDEAERQERAHYPN